MKGEEHQPSSETSKGNGLPHSLSPVRESGGKAQAGQGRGPRPCPQKQLSSLVETQVAGLVASLLLGAPGPLGRSPLPPMQLFHLALQPSHLGL